MHGACLALKLIGWPWSSHCISVQSTSQDGCEEKIGCPPACHFELLDGMVEIIQPDNSAGIIKCGKTSKNLLPIQSPEKLSANMQSNPQMILRYFFPQQLNWESPWNEARFWQVIAYERDFLTVSLANIELGLCIFIGGKPLKIMINSDFVVRCLLKMTAKMRSILIASMV